MHQLNFTIKNFIDAFFLNELCKLWVEGTRNVLSDCKPTGKLAETTINFIENGEAIEVSKQEQKT